MMQHSIKPGQVWLDSAGKRIQAHGGSIFYKDGLYHWYGENKEKTVKGSGIWHWGVRCYTSADLYNWEDRGLLIPPAPDDPASPLHPGRCMDRPHILFNQKTGKWVAWLKLMEGGDRQSMTILTADDFFGPYTLVKTGYRPLEMNSGDFDLAVDPLTGRGYIYFEKVHSEIICANLAEDFTGVTGQFSSHFAQPHPPFVREAPVHFMRGGKHYLFTSGTTGYYPNASEVAVADDWHGPFRVLGNPHPGDGSLSSFRSQITDVVQVEGSDLLIAAADRWAPHLPQWRLYSKYIEWQFARKFNPAARAKRLAARAAGKVKPRPMDNFNTVNATYVWLPMHFEGEMPVIDWRREWRVEDYLK